MIEKAREQIETEREIAMREMRRQVAVISVEVAGKVLGAKLESDREQQALVERFVNEMADSRPGEPNS